MIPTVKFHYGRCRCPICVVDGTSRKQYESLADIRIHLLNAHSMHGIYKYLVGSIPNRRGNYVLFISGFCACGCKKVIAYPTPGLEHRFMPPHGPPYYLSGHKSRVREPNSGTFKKGNIPWNTDLKGKGVCKPNSGSFKKGNIPPQERGGRYTDPNGQNYEWNGEYQPCGVRMYRAVSRLIMEKELGRKLTNQEVIIHLDGNPGNDARDNLELITRAEHATRNRWKGYTAPPKVKKPKRIKKAKIIKKLKKPNILIDIVEPIMENASVRSDWTYDYKLNAHELGVDANIEPSEPQELVEPVLVRKVLEIPESTRRPASPFCGKCGTLRSFGAGCPRCGV